MKCSKKVFISLLSVVMSACFVAGCGDPNIPEVTTTTVTSATTAEAVDTGLENLICEDDGYVIVLDTCKKEILLEARYEYFIPYITDELIEAADKHIASVLTADEIEKAVLKLQIDKEYYLSINGEIIRYLETEDDSQKGCGIDHDHIFINERITLQKQYR